MIYDSQVLGGLIMDAMRGYKQSREKIHPTRKRQVERLEEMCSAIEYDSMLVFAIRSIVNEIKGQEWGWFGHYPSRLRIVIEEALKAYHETIECVEIQQVLYEQASNALKKVPKMPTHRKILEETALLIERQQAITP